MKGSEWEFGIWPEESPGRGSWSTPVYLASREETKDAVTVIRTFHEILHRELFLISMNSDWSLIPFVRNLFKMLNISRTKKKERYQSLRMASALSWGAG